ncbi:MAG TPA: glutamate--cysteine ligase, partial [Ottowia sp.]|nr:glutamate--cysteine ligase [Ottowia sp.]
TLAVSYNGLESYAASLEEALTRPYPAYEAVGIQNPGGDYNQLGTTLLQIENEFYGTIRPKRVIGSGERPLHALRERGVEYVEVRLMDLNPFEPVGIDAPTARFLDVFLLHCLLTDSPPDTPREIAALKANQHLTAARGREPGLCLDRGGEAVRLVDWAARIVAELGPIAEAMDAVHGGSAYVDAVARARQRLAAPGELPSARVLQAVRDEHGGSFVAFTRAHSLDTRARLLALDYPAAIKSRFDALAAESVQAQLDIEAADRVPFETFRREYLSSRHLRLSGAVGSDAAAA